MVKKFTWEAHTKRVSHYIISIRTAFLEIFRGKFGNVNENKTCVLLVRMQACVIVVEVTIISQALVKEYGISILNKDLYFSCLMQH